MGHGLVQEFVHRGGEDALTELLAVLLRLPAFGEAFLAEFLGLEASADDLEVNTQVQDPETRARPDLVLSTLQDLVWVEAKLDADLTEKQPAVYVDVLRQSHPQKGHLVVLAKSSRWTELTHRLRARVGLPPSHERTFTHQGVPVTLITWREVRDLFQARALDEPITAYLLSEFVGVIDRYVERPVVPFTPEMIPVLHDPEMLRAFAALEDLLIDLRETLKAKGHKAQSLNGDQQTGFYAWPKGDKKDRLVWIGAIVRAGLVWPGRGPLWAWLCGDSFEEETAERLQGEGFEVIDPAEALPDWQACYLVPLRLEGGSPEETLGKLYHQIQQLWGMERRTGGEA